MTFSLYIFLITGWIWRKLQRDGVWEKGDLIKWSRGPGERKKGVGRWEGHLA